LILVGDRGEDGHLAFLRPRKFRAVSKAASNERAHRDLTPVQAAPAPEPRPVAATAGDREIDF
jgi:6-phosphogluconolactonase/glucosamine-6-phosphate isomerase/deaminase